MKINKFVKIFFAAVVVLLIVSGVLRTLTLNQQYQLVSTNITTEPFKVFDPIEVTLNKPISDQFLKSCGLTITPKTDGSLSANKNILRFTPTSNLAYATTYQVNLLCANISFQSSFVTQSIQELTPADEQHIQTSLDYEVGQQFQKMNQEQPWRQKLPIKKSTYELLYSQDQNKYFVYLSVSGATVPKAQIEADIQSELQKIGAPQLPLLYR